MFDFLSDEVFQIVVITALFVIGIMLFMLYKRPSENISQYMDDIDYRIEKMNKKLDELTNTFVNGLIIDEDDSDASSINIENNEEPEQVHKDEKVQEQRKDNILNEFQNKEIKSLSYEGIEFSDIPNFSTDTSVLDEDITKTREEFKELKELKEPGEPGELGELGEPEEPEKVDGKKRVNIIKRIIQSEE